MTFHTQNSKYTVLVDVLRAFASFVLTLIDINGIPAYCAVLPLVQPIKILDVLVIEGKVVQRTIGPDA